MQRPLLQLTITSRDGLKYSSVLTLDELPSLLVELGIATNLSALDAIRKDLLRRGVATLPSDPGETITLALLQE